MTERELVQELTKQIKDADIEGLFWHKLGDTFGGHKKPCDVIAAYMKHPFFLEFKKEGGTLTDSQREAMEKAALSGVIIYVCTFIKGRKHERDILCRPYVGDKERDGFILKWDKGKYIDLEMFFPRLDFKFHQVRG